MKLRVLFALLFLTFTAAVTTIPCDADAARMGGADPLAASLPCVPPQPVPRIRATLPAP